MRKDITDKWSSKEDLETQCHREVAHQLLQPDRNHFTVDTEEQDGRSHRHHRAHQTDDYRRNRVDDKDWLVFRADETES